MQENPELINELSSRLTNNYIDWKVKWQMALEIFRKKWLNFFCGIEKCFNSNHLDKQENN